MRYQLELFAKNRKSILILLNKFNIEQLNTIPKGHNNNLIWHAGHLLLTHQYLLYHSTNNPIVVDVEKYMGLFGSGTKPEGNADQSLINELINHLESTTTQTLQDWETDKFKTFNGPFTSDYYHVTVKTPEQALAFNVMHEAFHFGAMSSIKTALG